MTELNWIHVFLFLVLALRFQAITGQDSYITVRDGDESVTLPCRNLEKDQHGCNGTNWLHNQLPSSKVVELVSLGQINDNKFNRLTVTSDCSLVIKEIKPSDYGRYVCRQYKKHEHTDARVHLSVINMYEQTNEEIRKLICSVLRYEGCSHTVMLLDDGNVCNYTNQESPCSASMPFTSPLQRYACKVTDGNSGDVLLCSFDAQASCEKIYPNKRNRKWGSPTNQEDDTNTSNLPHWWMYIAAALGFAVLLIIVGVVVGRRRTKGSRARPDDGTGQSLNPAETRSGPDGFQDTVDFEVPYATISFKKRRNGDAQAGDEEADDDDDQEEEEEEGQNNVHGDDAVTYSCVAVPQKDSADLMGLYATVKKKKKEEVEEESLQ
ncbi:uncharacterized protein LOC124999277 isoform X2 [Mugil cephalus]|uniref:uncharacterized protein LOC124999277 isoform X2 n=1 Tax=Mugil cephalus TaxID=48193 RepID=UPI001FB84294|nr:uncharacterized protein LOC124999277 isoform X2 [Mugil cephalus]